jgi:predicted esterase YcpF (UPF0227 family)
MSKPFHLLYLHGFRSSPASAKARQTHARVRELNAARSAAPLQWLCPQLPASPRAAIDLALTLTQDVDASRLALIGSSLGGFYATWLAARLGCRAALLNPAVDPARDLRAQLGSQPCWHDPGLRFDFTATHVNELRALEVGALDAPVPQAERYLAVIARDDEVLDSAEMQARYAGATLRLAERGGHALDDYATRHLDAVLAFLLPTDS